MVEKYGYLVGSAIVPPTTRTSRAIIDSSGIRVIASTCLGIARINRKHAVYRLTLFILVVVFVLYVVVPCDFGKE